MVQHGRRVNRGRTRTRSARRAEAARVSRAAIRRVRALRKTHKRLCYALVVILVDDPRRRRRCTTCRGRLHRTSSAAGPRRAGMWAALHLAVVIATVTRCLLSVGLLLHTFRRWCTPFTLLLRYVACSSDTAVRALRVLVLRIATSTILRLRHLWHRLRRHTRTF